TQQKDKATMALREAPRQPRLSPEERRKQEETAAQHLAEEERRRQEAEDRRRLDEAEQIVPVPSAIPQQQFPRTTPEYWLNRVAVERELRAGDQPLVMISFASTDQQWVDDLRDYLDARMELLRDKDGQPYHLWNYSDVKRGTKVGDEFPEIVAEKMWRCRAAILLFSRFYFRS